jgi:hypothetical protein
VEEHPAEAIVKVAPLQVIQKTAIQETMDTPPSPIDKQITAVEDLLPNGDDSIDIPPVRKVLDTISLFFRIRSCCSGCLFSLFGYVLAYASLFVANFAVSSNSGPSHQATGGERVRFFIIGVLAIAYGLFRLYLLIRPRSKNEGPIPWWRWIIGW